MLVTSTELQAQQPANENRTVNLNYVYAATLGFGGYSLAGLTADVYTLPLAYTLHGVLATGCVANQMRGFIGQDIRAVQLTYGPPANEIDLGGGTRAFQWRKISVDTAPLSAVTTTDKDEKGRKTTQTQFVGGSQTVTNCLYTFVAEWDPKRNSWIVTSFRQPSLECAFGDLG